MSTYDYEESILSAQESEYDECASCPYKGAKCYSQCMEEEEIYNPVLKHYIQ